MRTARTGASQLLSPAGAGIGREPAPDARDRRNVSGVSGLRFAADDALAATAGPCGESQAGAPLDAADGFGGDLPEAESVPETSTESDLPLAAAPPRD